MNLARRLWTGDKVPLSCTYISKLGLVDIKGVIFMTLDSSKMGDLFTAIPL